MSAGGVSGPPYRGGPYDGGPAYDGGPPYDPYDRGAYGGGPFNGPHDAPSERPDRDPYRRPHPAEAPALQREDGEELEPNGGIVAAVVAAGVGCAALGVCTVAATAVPDFGDFLTVYAPAGPLTGKATVATLIYLIAWVNLHARLRDRELRMFRAFLVTMALLGVGLIGTFPPVYNLFR